jgi:hypothetical protein
MLGTLTTSALTAGVLLAALLGREPDQSRYPFDIQAKLTLMGGDGCPCLNVRFTNLGPENSKAFNYQVTQSKWLAGQKRYGTPVALNQFSEGAVPALAINGYRQKNFFLKLDSGSTYLFKVVYSPALNDANATNHNVELKYSLP